MAKNLNLKNKVKDFFIFLFLVYFVFSGNLQFIMAAGPVVSTGSASSIGLTSATLSGSVSDNGGSDIIDAGFEYGTTLSYGSSATADIVFTQGQSYGMPGTGDGLFNTPYGIAVDSSGNIYVADSNNHRVQKFDSSGTYLSQFGSFGTGDGQFNLAYGLDIDSLGNIYVTDALNNRIQKFDSNGTYLSQFGSSGTGDGQFATPTDVQIDSLGNIYVVDANNHRIQKFDSNGTYLSQFGSSGTGNGQFNTPIGIDFDSLGNIYVTDGLNQRLQKFDSSGVHILTFGVGGFGAGGPSGIYIDSEDNIFVVDRTSSLRRLRKYDSSGTLLRSLSIVSNGVGAAQLLGVTMNSDGHLLLTDLGGARFIETGISISDKQITGLSCGTTYNYRFYAENADGVTYGDNQTFTTTSCPPPPPPSIPEVSTLAASSVGQTSVTLSGKFTDGDGDLDTGGLITSRGFEYGLTTSYGQTFSENKNEVILSFGSFGAGNGQFDNPGGVATDLSGNIYVGDINNNRVQKFDSSGNWILNIVGNGGDFSSLSDIDIDSLGNVYVADVGNNRVQKFDSNGNFLLEIGTGLFAGLFNIGIDSSDNLYVADYNGARVAKFDADGAYIEDFASGSMMLCNPYDVDFDSSGNAYISDDCYGNVMTFDSSGNYLSDILPGFVFNSNVYVDGDDNLYVSSPGLSKIYVVETAGYTMVYEYTYLVGSTSFISVDDEGNVYAVDSSDNTVKKLSQNFSTTLSGLTCGTTYHFRAFAENNDGAGYGDDLTFTTTNCTSSGGGGGGSSGNNPNPILGCTDSDATNFNPSANTDNGSCLYTPGAINGCTDPSAGNYSSIATVDDGSCLYGVFGCTTPTALNYNPSAEYDDGSCQYDVIVPTDGGDPADPVYGCDDPSALNYDPSITSNDGTCDYTIPVVFGCTNISASNFDSNANQDDGSCTYIDIPGTTTLTNLVNSIISGVSSYISELPEPLKQSLPVAGLVVPSLLIGILQPGVFTGALLRLWNLIPVLMGYKRKKRPWGTVYDSITKQPLDPVYVSLKTLDGQEVSTSITDIDGRYGFLTSAGIYKITANKKDYIFPSQKLAGKTSDVLYDNLYFGEDLNVEEDDQVLFKNIPMDAVNFNWNEFEKAKNKKLMRFYSKRDLLLAKITNILFVLGFGSSVVLFFLSSSMLNTIVLSIYVLVLILRFFGIKPKQAGYVFDKEGNPLSFGIIRLYSNLLNREVGHTVLGKTGKYYLLTPNGEYFIKVQKKIGEDKYEDIYTSEAFKVKGGYVSKKIHI